LRIHGRALGLSPSFTVLDQADGADVMNLLREELGFAARGRRFPRKDTLASIHSRVVNAGVKLDDVVQRWYPWCVDDVDGIRLIFRAYVERKRAQQTLDYDDLLLFWKALRGFAGRGGRSSRGCSTTSSWTSTRTRTRSKPTSSRRCDRSGPIGI
jgi:DNA helicase-2/ATP-dependent DNA helicase PcrA